MTMRASLLRPSLGASLAFCVAAAGCVQVTEYAIDYSLGYRLPLGLKVDNERRGSPIHGEAFALLVVGTSDLGQALDALGAPSRFRRTPDEEVLEYFYSYGRSTRFILRPLFWLSHGGAASFNARGQEAGLDAIVLAFDHAGVLRRKELRRATPEATVEDMARSAVLQ